MEQTGSGWRRLHNEEFENLYISPNIIRVIYSRKWDGRSMEEMRNTYKILVRKS